MKNCVILTRGEKFSLDTMDGYAILPMEVFLAMGGAGHPACVEAAEKASIAIDVWVKAWTEAMADLPEDGGQE